MCKRTPIRPAILLVLLCAGCSQPDTALIVPGKSVGPYRLHEARSQIHGGGEQAYTHSAANGLILSFEGESVSIVSVLSTNYHTAEGVRLGSPENGVFAAYGQPDKKTADGFWDYRKLGIQFCCREGKVVLINVLDSW